MALRVISKSTTTSKYITFCDIGPRPGENTSRYDVIAKEDNAELGRIRWFDRWSKYVFIPNQDTETCFEETCLRDIAEFCETRTREYKAR